MHKLGHCNLLNLAGVISFCVLVSVSNVLAGAHTGSPHLFELSLSCTKWHFFYMFCKVRKLSHFFMKCLRVLLPYLYVIHMGLLCQGELCVPDTCRATAGGFLLPMKLLELLGLVIYTTRGDSVCR